MSRAPIISVKNVTKTFKNGEVTALQDVSFDVAEGEFLSLVGPSGCGKTTLLRVINGLIDVDHGEVISLGQAPEPGPDLAMVFQSARLLPWLTVSGNIEFVLELRGMGKAERRQRADALLGAVGLRDFAQAFAHELSGGMQQRVGLARALAVEPKVLLMDEPFAALDAITREVLRRELYEMWARRKTTIVFVTHDIEEAILLSQRIVLLKPRPGRVDSVINVDLPEPRFAQDPRTYPQFATYRSSIWQRIQDMAKEGTKLEELSGAFPKELP